MATISLGSEAPTFSFEHGPCILVRSRTYILTLQVDHRISFLRFDMPTTFFDLPPELWQLVKAYLEPWDLRTMICLHLADSRFSLLYDWDENTGEIWKLACWYNGIGLLPYEWERDDYHDNISWFDIALECIQKDGFCEHPHCGEACLEYNRASHAPL